MVASGGFIYTYRALEKERIEIAYLMKVPPIDTVRWLESHEPTSDINGRSFASDDERRLIEFLLSRRKQPLIDWGIARYGRSKNAIQRAFNRGDVGPRSLHWLIRVGKTDFVRGFGHPARRQAAASGDRL